MTVRTTSPAFKSNAHRALHDAQLQAALQNVRSVFIEKRQQAAAKLPEFEVLRDSARDIKDHTLAHLDLYLDAYSTRVTESGGTVHFARTAEEACTTIVDICQRHGAKIVSKGKSMVAEEIG